MTQNCASSLLHRRRSRLRIGMWAVLYFFVVLISLFPGGLSVVHADTTVPQFNAFWQQDGVAAFAQWTSDGIALNHQTASLQLMRGKTLLTCSRTDIDGGTASYDASVGLCAGHDPLTPGSYNNGLNYYNGGSFYFGTAVSPIITPAHTINSVVVSWNATTPTGTWMEVHIRTRQGSTWTNWYALPIWASAFDTIHRHSIDGQADAGGNISTDTYRTGSRTATSYQVGLTLFSTAPTISPTLRRVAAIASYNNAQKVQAVTPDRSVWGKNLAVPSRSQMLPVYQGQGYGGGGEVWCSPTSTSMVMAYWSGVLKNANLNRTVPDAAQGTYDFTYAGTGNWPFNTAYAGNFGLHAFVTRMYSLSQVEQWIKIGVPIIVSIAYQSGQLPGSPIPDTNGHLLVIRGFSTNGNVITNDPAAATDAQVQITYPRTIFESLWQNASNGTAYVIYPERWTTPTTGSLGSW